MTDRNDSFESQKNMKAGGLTLSICVLLLLVLLYVSWTQPTQPVPVTEEGIEVNLGNSDKGLGDKQPFLPANLRRSKKRNTPHPNKQQL